MPELQGKLKLLLVFLILWIVVLAGGKPAAAPEVGALGLIVIGGFARLLGVGYFAASNT